VPDRLPEHGLEPGRQPPPGQCVEIGVQPPGRLGGRLEVAELGEVRGSVSHYYREHPAVPGQNAHQALAALFQAGAHLAQAGLRGGPAQAAGLPAVLSDRALEFGMPADRGRVAIA
jgi:hypothetical protein